MSRRHPHPSFVDRSPPRYCPPSVNRLAPANFAAALFLCLHPGGVVAQPPAAAPAQPESFDGRPLREVRLVRLDPDDASKTLPISTTLEQLIRNQVRSEPGKPFSQAAARDDLTRLNRLSHFNTLRTDVQPLADGSVVLTFTFTQRQLIQDVQVVGNRLLSDQDILKEAQILAGTPIDRFQIDRNLRAIEEAYRRKGYYRCRVTVDEKELAESQIVLYRIIEGDRLRVADVRFQGNTAFSPRELRTVVNTTEYFPILEAGPLDDDVVAFDKTSLMQYYRDRGYLDATTDARYQPSPDGKEAIVTFEIREGPLYTLRSVRVLYGDPPGALSRTRGTSDTDKAIAQYRAEVLKDPAADLTYLTPEQLRQVGRSALTDAQITGLMTLKPGDVYTENKLRASVDAVRAAFSELGLLLFEGDRPEPASIRPTEVRDASAPLVDLILFIKTGEPTITGEITVIDNDITKQKVAMQRIELEPGRPLDLNASEQSVKNLESSGLFVRGQTRITIQPPDETRPGERDITVKVTEAPTGKVGLGVAVDSDAGLVGIISLQQSNFDLADPPRTFDELISGNAFRGAGQNFLLEILPGTTQQNYQLSLSEPALFETDYSGSGTVFFRNRDYREYDEQRYGARVGLGRRFGTVWNGQLQTRVESIQLSDIDPTDPVDYFIFEDESFITGVGVLFNRNTTDNRFRPGRGSFLSFGVEQAGAIGGDFDFTKLHGEYSTFFNVHETFLGYRTVLSLKTSVDYIPQDPDAVPVFERYYLGGRSFRGFAQRAVSPIGIRNDTRTPGDDPVGGTFSFFVGAEINQPVYKDIVSVVGFVDTGTVNNDVTLDNYRVSVGLGLRLYIKQLSDVPLAFDFGFPIMKEDTDRRRLFTFTLDIPFQ